MTDFVFNGYKNFNALKFKSENNIYIYETCSNNICLINNVVSDIIDDYLVLTKEEILSKYSSKFKIREIESAINEIDKNFSSGIFSNFKFDRMSLGNNKSTIEKVSEKTSCYLTQLVFNVTESCNFRCKYCIYSGSYEKRRSHNNRNNMTWDLSKKTIDLFINSSKYQAERYLSFYGGEALLNFPLIEKSICYASSIDDKIVFYITSNGSLLNERIIDFFAKFNVKLTISVDGPEKIHDKNRIDINGNPTHALVMRNIDMIREKYPEYYKNNIKINAVLTPFEGNYNELSDFFIDKLPFLKKSHKFNLGVVNSSTNDYVKNENYSEFFNKFRKHAIEKFRHHYSGTKSNILVEQKLLDKQIKQIHYRVHKSMRNYSYFWPNGICIPGMRSAFVSSNGLLFPCEKLYDYQDMCIGSVNNGINNEKIAKYIDEYCEIMENQCSNCWAFRLCGECFLSIRNNGKFDFKKRIQQCNIIKRVTAEALTLYTNIREVKADAFDEIENDIVPENFYKAMFED